MAFAKVTYRESVRDIEGCLRGRRNLVCDLGIRGQMAWGTLAAANEQRDWGIYSDLPQKRTAR